MKHQQSFSILKTSPGTNTYVVGTGPTRILIDTGQGFPAWRTRLSTVLSSENAKISHALLTHWHQDHVSGVPDLKSLCPDVRIHKGQLNKAEDHEDIHDGQVFSVQGATLAALSCPGHTKDHNVFILAEESDAIFTGDNVLGHGTAVFEDLPTYMDSLSKMHLRAVDGAKAYPGHGAVIENGKAKIREYIQHRRQREEEVLQTLAQHKLQVSSGSGDGEMTAMDIVKRIYHRYPDSLHEAAERGVLQILRKLEKEGRIKETEGTGTWTTVSSAQL